MYTTIVTGLISPHYSLISTNCCTTFCGFTNVQKKKKNKKEHLTLIKTLLKYIDEWCSEMKTAQRLPNKFEVLIVIV